MSDGSCAYDCSVEPTSLAPYADISGIGVILSYTITAGLVVFITLVGYLWIYDEHQYPFRTAEKPDAPPDWKPNPIDLMFLKAARRWLPRKRLVPQKMSGTWTPERLQAMFQKCVLSMSDLQILAGLSILISGFTQLRCGISAYYWQILVYLAWFSSLTHLGCLTFTRNYLYNHPGQRLWRLAAMFIIIVMLVVALFPTAWFNWTVSCSGESWPCVATSTPESYAICYYGRQHRIKASFGSDLSINFLSMIISCLLLIIGYTTRFARVAKTLSTIHVPRVRKSISGKARSVLQRVYRHSKGVGSPRSAETYLYYNPLLAVFIIIRVSLDIYTSMLMEVWWLLFGLSWGLVHLIQTLSLGAFDVSKGSWTFGQVVPLVLVAAPVLSVVESFFDEEEETKKPELTTNQPDPQEPIDRSSHTGDDTYRTGATDRGETTALGEESSASCHVQRVETLRIAERLHEGPLDGPQNNPECDFYKETAWVSWVVLYIACVVVMFSICIITYTALRVNITAWFLQPPPGLWWTYFAFSIPVTLWTFVLWAMIVDDHDHRAVHARERSIRGIALRMGLVGYFLFQMLCFGIGLPNTIEDPFVLALSLSPSTWLWAVVPWEAYLLLVATRVETRRDTVFVIAAGLLSGSFMAALLPRGLAFYDGFFSNDLNLYP